MSNVTNLASSSDTRGNDLVVRNVRAEMSYAGFKNQTELANALGVTQMWVSRRLSGGTPITADEIVMLADLFGIEPGALFARRVNPNRPVNAVKQDGHGAITDLAGWRARRGGAGLTVPFTQSEAARAH